MSINTEKPNKALKEKLRRMIASKKLHAVSRDLGIGRESLTRYLSDIPMHTATFRGIEATLSEAHLPEASESGLRR